jgi:hypothetical protein
LSFPLHCIAFSTVKHPILVWYLANVPLCGKYSPVSLVFVLIFSIFVLYKRTETLLENKKDENELWAVSDEQWEVGDERISVHHSPLIIKH